jgi:hypothetical protein
MFNFMTTRIEDMLPLHEVRISRVFRVQTIKVAKFTLPTND